MAKTKTPRPAPFRGRFHSARIRKESWERYATVVVDGIDTSKVAYARYLTDQVGEGFTVEVHSHKWAVIDSNRRFLCWLERATAWVNAHNRRVKAQ